MRANPSALNVSAHTRLNRFASRFYRDENGFTAVEFAMVSMPFLMLLFGTIAVGLFFFTTFSLENAVEKASRQIRTGQAQTAGKTTSQFKADVCALAPSFVDCTSNLRVNVVSSASFSGAAGSIGSCVDGGGALIPDPTPTTVPGAAGDVVLVTVCYEWEMTKILPFIDLGNMGSGSRLIQASTTFRTEPYN
jgi:Flp pilus assembly protein TadG